MLWQPSPHPSPPSFPHPSPPFTAMATPAVVDPAEFRDQRTRIEYPLVRDVAAVPVRVASASERLPHCGRSPGFSCGRRLWQSGKVKPGFSLFSLCQWRLCPALHATHKPGPRPIREPARPPPPGYGLGAMCLLLFVALHLPARPGPAHTELWHAPLPAPGRAVAPAAAHPGVRPGPNPCCVPHHGGMGASEEIALGLQGEVQKDLRPKKYRPGAV